MLSVSVFEWAKLGSEVYTSESSLSASCRGLCRVSFSRAESEKVEI